MKITRTYFLKQAWEAAKISDAIIVYSLENPETAMVRIDKKEGMNLDAVASYEIPMNFAICDRWKVVSMEPEVLTADECIKIDFKNNVKYMNQRESFHGGFDHGKSQGRLERDQELRPVTKMLDINIDQNSDNVYSHEELDAVYKNIKPLNPRESWT